MTKPVLVSGAAGRTGSAIVAALVARGATARGLVRTEAQAEKLALIGAGSVIGDLDRDDSLIEAARGCGTIIHVGPPMHPREVEQTKAMLAAAQRNGADHFIYYSVMHPLRQDVEHHRLKLLAEAEVVGNGIPYTILQPCRYMQHLEPIWSQVRDEGIHEMPFSIDAKFNLVDLMDLAEATALVATEPGHLYASYELAGPDALSQRDMAAILSERLGLPVVARKIELDEMARRAAAKGVAPERIERMVKMNRHYDHHGFRGNPNVLRWVIGREPTRFGDYAGRLIAAAV